MNIILILQNKREFWSCELIKMVGCECECVLWSFRVPLTILMSDHDYGTYLLMFYVIPVYSLYYSETSITVKPSQAYPPRFY